MREHVDICVVGGGIVGLYCAAELTQAGYSVRLIDRAYHGMQRENIGEISLHGHPLTLHQFIPYCDKQWLGGALQMAHDVGIKPTGSLRLATSEDELEMLKLQSNVISTSGFKGYVIEEKDLLEDILGGVRLGEAVKGGMVVSSDLAVDATHALKKIQTFLVQHNCRIWGGDEVRQFHVTPPKSKDDVPTVAGVVTSSGDECFADVTVVCAGVHAGGLLKSLGVEIPLRPARMHLLECIPTDKLPIPTMIQPQEHGIIRIKTLESGRALVTYDGILDATQATYSKDVDPIVSQWLQYQMGQYCLPLQYAKVTDIRTMTLAITPDLAPCIGFDSRINGLFMAVGMNGHSFTYAAGVSGLLQQTLKGEDPDFPTYMLEPDRFALGNWTPLTAKQLARSLGLMPRRKNTANDESLQAETNENIEKAKAEATPEEVKVEEAQEPEKIIDNAEDAAEEEKPEVDIEVERDKSEFMDANGQDMATKVEKAQSEVGADMTTQVEQADGEVSGDLKSNIEGDDKNINTKETPEVQRAELSQPAPEPPKQKMREIKTRETKKKVQTASIRTAK